LWLLHLASAIWLTHPLHSLFPGISLKTQALYLLVFVTRYLDLFDSHAFPSFARPLSVYNFIMKLVFIASSAFVVYLMAAKKPICETYDKKADSFNVLILIIPSLVLAFFFHEAPGFVEVRKTFLRQSFS
jgi:ER lumen protein retaining receptor